MGCGALLRALRAPLPPCMLRPLRKFRICGHSAACCHCSRLHAHCLIGSTTPTNHPASCMHARRLSAEIVRTDAAEKEVQRLRAKFGRKLWQLDERHQVGAGGPGARHVRACVRMCVGV